MACAAGRRRPAADAAPWRTVRRACGAAAAERRRGGLEAPAGAVRRQRRLQRLGACQQRVGIGEVAAAAGPLHLQS